MSGKEIRWHEYDLNIVEVLQRFSNGLKAIPKKELNKSVDITALIKNAQLIIKAYCKLKGIKNRKNPIIVTSIDIEPYQTFLSFSLSQYQVAKIFSFLDYQYRQYQGSVNFFNLIEFNVYQIIIQCSPFDNMDRLNKVMDWVRENSTMKHPKKANPVVCFQSTLNSKQRKSLLLAFKDLGYTKQPQKLLDFLSGDNKAVFILESHKIHHMSYLLFCLNNENLIKLNRGKGYFKHFETHYSEKWVWREMKDYKREIVNSKTSESPVFKEVEAIIADIKQRK